VDQTKSIYHPSSSKLVWIKQNQYWLPLPPAGHTGQSSSTPLPPSVLGYWSLSWAPLARGQAPPWGMPPWTTSVPQSQRPSYSPPTVRHFCPLSIVTFVIPANVEQLANSSIYVFKRPSSSAGCDFTDAVLNMRGFGEGGGTNNDAAP
jgi:hypothetical protein